MTGSENIPSTVPSRVDLTTAALGLLALDAAFLLLVALAGHPPQRPQEVRVVLEGTPPARIEAAPPALRGQPREIVVSILGGDTGDSDLPMPKPAPRILAVVPLREFQVEITGPPPTIRLLDGTGELPPPDEPAEADRLVATPAGPDMPVDEIAGAAQAGEAAAVDRLAAAGDQAPLAEQADAATFASLADRIDAAGGDAVPEGELAAISPVSAWPSSADQVAASDPEPPSPMDRTTRLAGWPAESDRLLASQDPGTGDEADETGFAGRAGWLAAGDALEPAAPPQAEIPAAWTARPWELASLADQLLTEAPAAPGTDELALASRGGWQADSDRIAAAPPPATADADELAIPTPTAAVETDLLIPAPPAAALAADETASPRSADMRAIADLLIPAPPAAAADRDELVLADRGAWSAGSDRLVASRPAPTLLPDETAFGAERPVALADTIPAVPYQPFTAEESLFITMLRPSWELDADTVVEAESDALALASLPDAGKLAPGLEAEVQSAQKLAGLFDSLDYAPTDGSVPSLYVQRLPRDIGAVPQVDVRKALFVRTVLPIVVSVNERTLRLRERVLSLAPQIAADALLDPVDIDFLAGLMEEFRVSRWDTAEMLRRLDVVPPSLALAQAAEESGWGTSRAAQDDNALFGQTLFIGRTSQVKPFDDLVGTVKAYIANLNTHRAYADLRRQREQLRAAGKTIDGHSLAPHLLRYSERGNAYVQTIRGLITSNNLTAFDRVKLREQVVEAVP